MSRTPEGTVKDYLRKRITALGGELRFVAWVGRRNAPDTRVMLTGRNCWAETKAGKDGQLSGGQIREIARMREQGEIVLVLTTKAEIDKEFPL